MCHLYSTYTRGRLWTRFVPLVFNPGVHCLDSLLSTWVVLWTRRLVPPVFNPRLGRLVDTSRATCIRPVAEHTVYYVV